MDEDVKQPEELMAEGGEFYDLGGEAWCDTPLDSWRLVPGKGYVRRRDGDEGEP